MLPTKQQVHILVYQLQRKVCPFFIVLTFIFVAVRGGGRGTEADGSSGGGGRGITSGCIHDGDCAADYGKVVVRIFLVVTFVVR